MGGSSLVALDAAVLRLRRASPGLFLRRLLWALLRAHGRGRCKEQGTDSLLREQRPLFPVRTGLGALPIRRAHAAVVPQSDVPFGGTVGAASSGGVGRGRGPDQRREEADSY